MTTLICPNCRSTNLRRSRAVGPKETVMKMFNRKPFRCRDCGWRGIMFSRKGGSGGVSKKKAYLFAAVFSFIILVLLVVFNLRPEVIQNIVRQMIGSPK